MICMHGSTNILLDVYKLENNMYFLLDGSENVTGLDLSDFPALADRNRREGSGNPTPLINPLAGRAPYGECESGGFAELII